MMSNSLLLYTVSGFPLTLPCHINFKCYGTEYYSQSNSWPNKGKYNKLYRMHWWVVLFLHNVRFHYSWLYEQFFFKCQTFGYVYPTNVLSSVPHMPTIVSKVLHICQFMELTHFKNDINHMYTMWNFYGNFRKLPDLLSSLNMSK